MKPYWEALSIPQPDIDGLKLRGSDLYDKLVELGKLAQLRAPQLTSRFIEIKLTSLSSLKRQWDEAIPSFRFKGEKKNTRSSLPSHKVARQHEQHKRDTILDFALNDTIDALEAATASHYKLNQLFKPSKILNDLDLQGKSL